MPELVQQMSAEEARRVTERIRLTLDTASQSLDRLSALVSDAYDRRADVALGYDSWEAYAAAEFSEATRNLAAPIRRELVGYLSAAGMSTRAIAPAVGVSQKTADRDVRQVSHFDSPAPLDLATVDMRTGEIIETPTTAPVDAPASRPVVGLDGKTYARPAVSAPRRAALPQLVQSAGWDLAKSIDRLQLLAADDRFASHKQEMAPHLRSHLTHAIEVCQDLLDLINNNN